MGGAATTKMMVGGRTLGPALSASNAAFRRSAQRMAAPAVARAVFEVFKSWSPTAAGKGHRRPFDVAVVTSAALPWRTGPSFFSLLHACGLAYLGLRVAYVIPWLRPASQ